MSLRSALPAAVLTALIAGVLIPVTPALAASAATPETSISIDNAKYDDAARFEVSGELEIVDANVPIGADGIPLGPDVASTTYLVTDNGDRIPLEGDLPEGATSGSSFEGTVALTPSAIAELPAAHPEVVAAASESPLAADDEDAQHVLASVSTDQVPMPVARGTVKPAAAPTTVNGPLAHQFYVAVVGAKNSPVTHSAFSPGAMSSLTSTVSKYWTAQSGGIVDGITITESVRYTSDVACSTGKDAVNKWWAEAAAKFSDSPKAFFGAGTGRHLVVLLPDGSSAVGPCAKKLGFTGLATVGAGTNAGGYIFAAVGTTLAPATLAHEFGHNLSLGHANIAVCASTTVSEAPGTGCAIDDYYDLYDVMGATVVGQKGIPSLSFPAKQRLGFVTGPDVATVELASGATETTVTSVIEPIAGADGVRGVRVTDPVSGKVYFIELRTGLGQDKGLKANKDSFSVAARNGTSSTRYGYGNGVRILTDDRATTRNPETLALALASPTSATSKTRSLALHTLDGFSSASGGVHVDVDWTTPRAASVTVHLTSAATLQASTKGSVLGGSAVIGKKLTAPTQFFRQLGVTRSFQWLRGGSVIDGATAASYTVTKSDAGASLSVRVTGSRSGMAPATQVSSSVKTGTANPRAGVAVTAIAPDPAATAGSAVTPYVIVYNGGGKSGSVTLSATSPSRTTLASKAFDRNGIAMIAVPWKLGAVTQTIVGRLSDGRTSTPVVIAPERRSTSVKLTVPSTASKTVTAKVALAGVSTARKPGGSVEIYDGETLIATQTVTSASASIALRFDSTGSRELTAVYVGDANYHGATSSAKALTVR